LVVADARVGQSVNAWRGRRAAVNAEVSPADVVDQDEDDVRLLLFAVCAEARMLMASAQTSPMRMFFVFMVVSFASRNRPDMLNELAHR
jgi:hypothetical protein